MHEITASTVFQQAGHHIGSAGHADGSRIVMTIKDQSLSTKLINMRGLHVRVAIATKGIIGLIVGEKEDDVGAILTQHTPAGNQTDQDPNQGSLI